MQCFKRLVAIAVVLSCHLSWADELVEEPAVPRPKKTAIRALVELFTPKVRVIEASAVVVEDRIFAVPFGRAGALPAGSRAWGPEQVIGPPNTPGAGDIQTAWASNTQDGQNEWLELEYAELVEPAVVIVHENHNPGAVFKIEAYSKTGMGAELWSGKDPTPVGAARGISKIEIETAFKTKKIRVHIKSKEVPGWNEIDAVGIQDKAGKVHWAVKVRASSSYASDDMPDEGVAIKGPAVAVEAVEERDRKAKLKEEIENYRRLEERLAAQLKAIQDTRKAREKALEDLEKEGEDIKDE